MKILVEKYDVYANKEKIEVDLNLKEKYIIYNNKKLKIKKDNKGFIQHRNPHYSIVIGFESMIKEEIWMLK